MNTNRPHILSWIRVLGTFILVVSSSSNDTLLAKGVEQHIRFKAKTPSTTVRQSVLRGERDTYRLRGRAGQKLSVRVTSQESNAAFFILRPGRKNALPRAGEMDDATRWNGTLPSTGEYSIVVGATRGNASYKLIVTLR